MLPRFAAVVVLRAHGESAKFPGTSNDVLDVVDLGMGGNDETDGVE